MKKIILLTVLISSQPLIAQNVGIGIAAPLSKLHVFSGASGNITPFSPLVVEGSNNTYINLLSPNANETAILFGKAENAASGGIVYNNSGTLNGFQFRVNGNVTRMVIDNTGNVGVGTAAPAASAKLDVTSTSSGFLPPRMTTAQRDAIASAAEGLIIYNTNSKAVEFYNGTSWFGTTHYIGESYGGGIVFYVYENGQHGLIAATADQSTGIQWYNGSFTNTNAIRDGIAVNSYNTEHIIVNQGAGNYAAMVCAKFNGGGYGDWYLPSKYELNLLYLQRNLVGGFTIFSYWSSTEFNANSAWLQGFNNGQQTSDSKSFGLYVRPVRAF